MEKPYDEALGEILDQVYANVLAYRCSEVFTIDQVSDAARFIDDCSWAVIFGGSFKEEIIRVADEVLEEDDSNRNQSLDCR